MRSVVGMDALVAATLLTTRSEAYFASKSILD